MNPYRTVRMSAGNMAPLVFTMVVACIPQTAKSPLKAADAALVLACEGIAQSLADRSGADAQRIVAATCAVEGFTRTLREMLLSQQLEAARAAGVAVPAITSDHLEPSPFEEGAAE